MQICSSTTSASPVEPSMDDTAQDLCFDNPSPRRGPIGVANPSGARDSIGGWGDNTRTVSMDQKTSCWAAAGRFSSYRTGCRSAGINQRRARALAIEQIDPLLGGVIHDMLRDMIRPVLMSH